MGILSARRAAAMPPSSVRQTLKKLPESFDETYGIVIDIRKANKPQAYRMLQCLVVAIRPLSVAELAELLAIEVDAAKGDNILKLNTDWRWEDHEHAILSTCSSLITIVGSGASGVVQFSHFSVKEFLMSDRLATFPGSRMLPRASATGWKNSLTETGRTFQRGSSYTMPTTVYGPRN
jgi:hypothetical protein